MQTLTKIQKQILSERRAFGNGITIARRAFDEQQRRLYIASDLIPVLQHETAHERKLLREIIAKRRNSEMSAKSYDNQPQKPERKKLSKAN